MSIWESDWTDSSTKVKKILLMVMQRANKPICLYVGSFYPISTETALTVNLSENTRKLIKNCIFIAANERILFLCGVAQTVL